MPEEFEKKVKSKQKKKIAIWTTVGVATVALGLGLGLGFGLKGEKLYEIDLSSSLENAEILGEGKYKLGEEITIKAKEVENYRFSHWELNGKAVSTDSTYTFTLSMETIGSYKAVYVEDTVTANIYIDGTMSTKDVSKGTTLLEIVEQTDITDENSCGWFLDDKLIQVADLTQEMNENTNLYTKRATLDNLTFTFSRDESTYEVACTDTTTTEDIVVPKKI